MKDLSEKEKKILMIQSNEIESMFDIFNNILMKYSDNLYEASNFEALFSPFMLCRYLSMKQSLIFIAEYLSTVLSTSKLNNVQFYKLAYYLVPKQESSYVQYIKKNRNKDMKEINNNNENNIIKSSLYDL